MKNSPKDRYDHKLIRFIKDLSFRGPITLAEVYQRMEKTYKEYGFTHDDFYKACRLIRSNPSDKLCGLRKTKRYLRRKKLREEGHDRNASDNADNTDRIKVPVL